MDGKGLKRQATDIPVAPLLAKNFTIKRVCFYDYTYTMYLHNVFVIM